MQEFTSVYLTYLHPSEGTKHLKILEYLNIEKVWKSVIFSWGLGKISIFWRQTLVIFFIFLVCWFVTWSALLAGNPIETPEIFQRLVCLWSHPNDTRFCKQSKQGGKTTPVLDSFMVVVAFQTGNMTHTMTLKEETSTMTYPGSVVSVVTSCGFILWVMSEGA